MPPKKPGKKAVEAAEAKEAEEAAAAEAKAAEEKPAEEKPAEEKPAEALEEGEVPAPKPAEPEKPKEPEAPKPRVRKPPMRMSYAAKPSEQTTPLTFHGKIAEISRVEDKAVMRIRFQDPEDAKKACEPPPHIAGFRLVEVVAAPPENGVADPKIVHAAW